MELTAIEKLDRLERMTNPDGSVNVELVGFQKDGPDACITLVTPNGDKETLRYRWPDRATEDYKLVRIAERYCGGLTGLDDLNNLPVEARATIEDGSYSIVAPEPTRLRDHLITLLSGAYAFLILFTIVSIPMWPVYGMLTYLGYVPNLHPIIYVGWMLLVALVVIAEDGS